MIMSACSSLLLGVILGMLLLPGLNEPDHVSGVASARFETRDDAWAWWRSGNELLPLDELNRSLELAGPDAFLHGAEQLRRMGRWGWDHQPIPMIERHLELLTWRSHVLDIEDAIDITRSAPMSMSNEVMIQAARSLLAHPDEVVAGHAFHALVEWAGFRPVLDDVLDMLPMDRDAWARPYRYWQASGPVPLPMHPVDGDEEMMGIEDLVLEEVRKQTLESDPDLRRNMAMAWLEDREPLHPQQGEQDVLSGDNRRIAGALLAAHERLDPAILEQAMHLEEDARVRTVIRLAIDVVGPPWRGEDADEFARRALRNQLEGDSLFPVACRMMAGDIELLGPRLDLAASGSRPERIRSLRLIAWLGPDWVQLDGRLDTMDEVSMAAFYDRLKARWHLEHRWLVNSTSTTDDGQHD
ncbi:MAG: hypothetical protein CMJ36_05215 [Phycisphaerae bacterium]|nr:hypothetical protein [Phycisphaerae bacterium]